MNRAEWTWRVGVLAIGAMFLTTGCGLFSSSAANKPAVHPAAHAAHAAHAGGKGAHTGGNSGGRTGASTHAHSRSHASQGQGAAASASSVASAVQSMFGQIGQSSGAQTHAAGTGTSTGGKSAGTTSTTSTTSTKPAGQTPAQQGGALQSAAHSKSLKPSEAKIVQPYVAELESLRGQYLSSLISLYNQARADYHQGKGSKLAIESKYIPQIASLENSAQDQVNSILFALRDQLAAHGYPTTEMNTLRSGFYSEVQQAISSLRR